ncbi:hypothetical protein RND71_041206 [Anisodus tanguticus]|uniref:Uncharacterized protein n=1 Tax=Anisodus tanguticus TaxID=243964 RepID=A0AAE1UWH3_9SOLA|nr:hypothetical protein RND71_041206 [Anisodus tanguticus]
MRNTEEMLCKLGLWNLASMGNVMINLTSTILSYYRIHGKGWTPSRKTKKVVLQFCECEYVPSWFSSKLVRSLCVGLEVLSSKLVSSKFTKESCTSFKVPTCNSRIEGLSFCIVYKRSTIGLSPSVFVPTPNSAFKNFSSCHAQSSRKTPSPLFYGVPGGKLGTMWLSHWKLENQLINDDVIEVTFTSGDGITVMEFGIKILHVEEPKVLGGSSCEDASGERDIVNPFWDVVLGDASSSCFGFLLLIVPYGLLMSPLSSLSLHVCPISSECTDKEFMSLSQEHHKSFDGGETTIQKEMEKRTPTDISLYGATN